MITSDAVDFSERRPEEVISFFWRSVYIFRRFIIESVNSVQSTLLSPIRISLIIA